MVARIKYLCSKKGITLSQLETECGFPQNAIYKWADHSPSVDKVKIVAQYLGVSVDSLLVGGHVAAPEGDEVAFLDLFRGLDPSAQELVIKQMEWMVASHKKTAPADPAEA